MIAKEMEDRLNQQMNAEFQAAYSYLGMATYCRNQSLNGFAHWFDLQADEEKAHAMKIYTYLLDQDAEVVLDALDSAKTDYKNSLDVFEAALSQEQEVTKLINDLFGYAQEKDDHATRIFMQWYVTEQIEEEASIRDIIDRLKLVGDNGEGILILDKELGGRTPEED